MSILKNQEMFFQHKKLTNCASWTISDGEGGPLYAGDGVVPSLSVTRLTPHFHHSSDYHGECGGGFHI